MNGIERIARERQRQIDEEGWTPEHDDEHDAGELAAAAASYAMTADDFHPAGDYPRSWPWDRRWWKPSLDTIRNLEKAGALIAAEIDRRLRLGETATRPEPGDAEQKEEER